jgi:hypothetical protein
MNVVQGVLVPRSGAGSMPWSLRIALIVLPDVVAETLQPAADPCVTPGRILGRHLVDVAGSTGLEPAASGVAGQHQQRHIAADPGISVSPRRAPSDADGQSVVGSPRSMASCADSEGDVSERTAGRLPNKVPRAVIGLRPAGSVNFSTRCSLPFGVVTGQNPAIFARCPAQGSTAPATVANKLFTTVARRKTSGCKLLIWCALQDSNLRPPGS